MVNVYKTKIDIKNIKPSFKPIFVQYDHARLEIELVDNGRKYDLSNINRVEFTHIRGDGAVIIQPGEIVTDDKKQIIRYEYQGNEMDAIGTVETSFAVFDANNRKVSTHAFNVSIVKDLREDLFKPAEPNFGLLQTLIDDVEEVKKLGGIKGDPGEKGEKGDPGTGNDERLDRFIEISEVRSSVVNSTNVLFNGVTHTIINENTVNATVTGANGGYVGFSIPYDANKRFLAVYKLINPNTTNVGSLRARIDYRNGISGVTQELGSALLTPTRTILAGETYQSTLEFVLEPGKTRSYASFGFFTPNPSVNFSLELKVYDITGMTSDEIATIDWVNMSATPILKADYAKQATVAERVLNGGSNWRGKRWLTLGDSITSPGTYQNLVKEQLGFSAVNNKGIAGSAVLAMLNDVTDADIQNADLITLYGCFNNFTEGAPSLGSVTDEPKGVMSGNTFISNLKYVIEYILTRKPTARLVIIGTHNGTDANRPDLNMPVNGTDTIADYTKAMGDVARYYGLPFIDMYGRSGINAFNLNNFTRDGLHLNWDGYVRVAEVITGDLRGLEPI